MHTTSAIVGAYWRTIRELLCASETQAQPNTCGVSWHSHLACRVHNPIIKDLIVWLDIRFLCDASDSHASVCGGSRRPEAPSAKSSEAFNATARPFFRKSMFFDCGPCH